MDIILLSVTKFRTISHKAYKLKVRFVVKFDFFFSDIHVMTHFRAVFVVKTG